MLGQLDQWLDGPGETGWVVVTGGPGMGKSAILSAWLARREATGAVVPHHFVRRQVADWDQPEVIAVSLAAQIEAAFPAQRDAEAKPERRLIELLGRVSKHLGATRGLVVMVDGLDETRAEPGENPLPRFLPHVVPAGIRFLCATRPTYPHLNWIEARSPVRRLDLDDPRSASSNEAVVRGFWEAIVSEYQPPLSGKTMDAAITRAEGNVLHAVMLHDALRDLPAEERRADRIPRGLKGLIGEIWDRAAVHEAVRVGLGLLCAAQEALSLDVLTELAGWTYDDKQRFVRDARQLLLEEPASWAGVEAYRPRHDWVRELIAERLGAASIRAHHVTLSRTLAIWPPSLDETRRSYAVRHALAHRIAIGDWSGVRELASDLGYLEARAYAADVFVVEQELRDAGKICLEPAVAHDLADLARALARESHWIRDDPGGTAGLIWNRLRRLGPTAEDLAIRLAMPAGMEFLRVRRALSRASTSLERIFSSHIGSVRACAVTPDGRRVISASLDGTLKIWGLDAGRVLATWQSLAGSVNGCAVTPDGRRVVSAFFNGTLKVWDLDAGRVLATFQGHADEVTACVVTPDGRRVISASADQTLKVWEFDTGRVLATLDGHANWVRACAVAPDGRRAISASHDHTLRIWDLDAGRALATLDGHEDWVTACAVTPDGRRVISASHDHTLRVWDLDTARVLATLRDHADGVRACTVTSDGRRVVSASNDRTLKVWDLDAGRVLTTIDGHGDRVNACTVTPDGRHVVSASDDHTVKVWSLETNRDLTAFGGHADRVNVCAVTPDGVRVVSASDDGTLKVWDLETGRIVATLHDYTNWARACTVTPDGRRVVSSSYNGMLKVWDLNSGRVLATLHGHAAFVTACAVAPDGRRMVAAFVDRTLEVWDLDARRVLTILRGHTASVTSCAVTPDGRCVVSGSNDNTLKVWDLDTGRVLATLRGHAARVTSCAVTPDGRRVASGSDDRTVKLWDLEIGHVLATLQGHTRGVHACAVTPDGRRVVSGGDDRTLKVWDLASASCLLTHRGDAAFQCVVATSGGVIAGDRAGTLWFLDWPRESFPQP